MTNENFFISAIFLNKIEFELTFDSWSSESTALASLFEIMNAIGLGPCNNYVTLLWVLWS